MRPFTPPQLLDILQRLLPVKRLRIAYSGGRDSTVLLYALAALKRELAGIELQAVHVDHGLHRRSGAWSQWCVDSAAGLDIECRVMPVTVAIARGESREARAREARYRAFATLLEPGDCLLTAHHQDDQAETVLLQLLRGAGVRGLAGMPAIADFSRGRIARPLLGFAREALQAWAVAQQVEWIDDPANFDIDYDRNYLRLHVLPVIRRRWPSMAATLSRAADHCAAAGGLLDDLAAADLRSTGDANDGTLSVNRLRGLDAARRRNLVRFWLRTRGLPLPSQARLEQLLVQALAAGADRQPCIRWNGGEVRRYRDRLHAAAPAAPHDAGQVLAWDMHAPLMLPSLGRQLTAIAAGGDGLSVRQCRSAPVTVRFRTGGERCRPAGQRHHRPLKKLLQEHGIPQWERDRIPLLYVGEHLAAVIGHWICEPFQAIAGEASFRIEVRNII